MTTLQFQSTDHATTCVIFEPGNYAMILAPELPVRFQSAMQIIEARRSRAGHDADAQKSERFPVVAS